MATAELNRRRFLSIAACAVGVPSIANATIPLAHWNGIALGARTSLKLAGIETHDAAPIFQAVEDELSRLENIFSLYRPGSEITQLNTNGVLPNPSPEFTELLGLVDGIHISTGGAFDPTIQPLWMTYAHAATRGQKPNANALNQARMRTGWQQVKFDTQKISFEADGMALTLNGIAQGYVTDQITKLLARHGFTNIMVDMGETRALGKHPNGRSWRAGVVTPANDLISTLELSDRALATSATHGTLLDPSGSISHIIDPRDGLAKAANVIVSVSAPKAVLADGLSTAFCILSPAEIDTAVNEWPDTKIEVLTELG